MRHHGVSGRLLLCSEDAKDRFRPGWSWASFRLQQIRQAAGCVGAEATAGVSWAPAVSACELAHRILLKQDTSRLRLRSWANAVVDVMCFYLLVGGSGLVAIQAVSGYTSIIFREIGKTGPGKATPSAEPAPRAYNTIWTMRKHALLDLARDVQAKSTCLYTSRSSCRCLLW